MRLLNVTSRTLKTFIDERQVPEYAILSHTWESNEVTFEDLQEDPLLLDDDDSIDLIRTAKIRNACKTALSDGFAYIWIDTCCINKSSHSELSEAINSMYRWYAKSACCYAYLWDVPDHEVLCGRPGKPFAKSKWFTRGWTLQELIAPKRVVFYSTNWKDLDSKLPKDLRSGFIQRLSSITGIDVGVLNGTTALDSVSVAKKMSWAANRQTTRLEDGAYCLMGLFDVNMPMLYGEGVKSFRRLQEEIVKSSPDETLFMWRTEALSHRYASGLLAESPQDFAASGNFVRDGSDREVPFWMTNRGLCIRLELTPLKKPDEETQKGDLYMGTLCASYHTAQVSQPDDAKPWGICLRRLNRNGNVFERTKLDTLIPHLRREGARQETIFVDQKISVSTEGPDQRRLFLSDNYEACFFESVTFRSLYTGQIDKLYMSHGSTSLGSRKNILSFPFTGSGCRVVAVLDFKPRNTDHVYILAYTDWKGELQIARSAGWKNSNGSWVSYNDLEAEAKFLDSAPLQSVSVKSISVDFQLIQRDNETWLDVSSIK